MSLTYKDTWNAQLLLILWTNNFHSSLAFSSGLQDGWCSSPQKIGHPGFRQQKDVVGSKCSSLRKAKAFPKAPSRLLLTTHWPQLGHKAASTFKGGWAANYFALPDSSWLRLGRRGLGMGIGLANQWALPQMQCCDWPGLIHTPTSKAGVDSSPAQDQWTEHDRGKLGAINIKGIINASQTRVKAVCYYLCLRLLWDLASPEGHSIYH